MKHWLRVTLHWMQMFIIKGSTWGVKLPVGTRHAYERVPFREAYPDFTKWVDSKGASNQKWYENFVDEKTIRYW